MSFNSLLSPVLPSRFCRLCKSSTNLSKPIRNPLRIGITPSMQKSTSPNSSQHASFSTINPSAQLTSSSNSSIKPSSSGTLHSENQIGFATILSRPSSTDEDHEDASATGSEENVTRNLDSIRITEAAARRIRYIKEVDRNQKLVLRLAVESGGCHGFQYKMNFTDSIESDDYVFSLGDESLGLVAIDSGSLQLMNGSTLDFATELIGSSFRILDNPNAAGPGCGCGVSWELK